MLSDLRLETNYEIEIILKPKKKTTGISTIKYIWNIFDIVFDGSVPKGIIDKRSDKNTTIINEIDPTKFINNSKSNYVSLIKKCVKIVDIIKNDGRFKIKSFTFSNDTFCGCTYCDDPINFLSLYDNRYKYNDYIMSVRNDVIGFWNYRRRLERLDRIKQNECRIDNKGKTPKKRSRK